MKTAPIVAATLAFDADGVPCSPEYRDRYHPRVGAAAQSRHVFLGGNDLPARWQGRDRFVVLETGFGLGNNFLSTWHAWREDPQRCRQLFFVSVERHPLRATDLASVHGASPWADLARTLHSAWPPLTPNLHRLGFEGGRVQLLLALGDVQAWLPELVTSVDAFFLDGFAPAVNPRMWDERVCKALGRLAAPGATLATWSAARRLRDHLTSAGFETRLGHGSGGKRDITLARFEPRFTPRRAAARTAAARAGVPPRALIVGGGLAGCAAAWALAEHGWHSTVIERHAQVAAEASGNPAGLFHGTVNPHDGAHARFNRAAALAASEAVRCAVSAHGVRGSAQGLLRLESSLQPAEMKALLLRLGLPPDYLQALGTREASMLAGIALAHPAWFYPGGGWVHPAGLARSFLDRAAAHVTVRHGVEVDVLHRTDSGWRLLDTSGNTLDEAQTIVLANAGDALRLLANPDWTMQPVRGQISILRKDATTTLALPHLPVAGAGYLLPEIDGAAIFGATAQPGDMDPSVRLADHRHNLDQLERLTGQRIDAESADLRGRTAWRWSTSDRLPIIGAVAQTNPTTSARLDQPRFVPRQAGLFVFSALGSRGITWSALGAQVLACAITGAPMPGEASLLDAIDPARFVSRRARRAASA
ncbi:MAG: bifunctional tRNA (5-methylaminomethyl-2-thiouridine)(34)-methyltransferase MnmD/FAD-dependent 5-carboxymethylaminomethyl-2-thiouridine(34) oxidoreductase MnmC [Burkholderiaceae bacterium]